MDAPDAGRAEVRQSGSSGSILTERRLFSLHGRILLRINRHPGQTAAEIADALGLNIGTVWTVIGDLRAEDMVIVRRRNRRHVYYANMDGTLKDRVADSVRIGAILGALSGDDHIPIPTS